MVLAVNLLYDAASESTTMSLESWTRADCAARVRRGAIVWAERFLVLLEAGGGCNSWVWSSRLIWVLIHHDGVCLSCDFFLFF